MSIRNARGEVQKRLDELLDLLILLETFGQPGGEWAGATFANHRFLTHYLSYFTPTG